MGKKAYLECGKILTAHGVHGAMQVASLCDTPAVLCSLPCVYMLKNGQYTPYPVSVATPHKNGGLMTLVGIENREEALALRGVMLYAKREDIPLGEGAVLVADMLGLTVYDAESGRVYGVLDDLQPAPASDLYDIVTPGGRHVLFPAVPAFLDRVDTESGIYIRPIPGFFDEENG